MAVCAAWLPARVIAYDPVAAPAWAAEPGCVRHLYVFPDASLNPLADESANTFGSATAVVAPGPYSSGWHDPDPDLPILRLCGDPGNGAWDLGKGPDGSIRITIPIEDKSRYSTPVTFRLNLQVNVVIYDVMLTFPNCSVDGYAFSSQTSQDSVSAFDPKLGVWYNRTWSLHIDRMFEDQVTVVLSADQTWGSQVDAVEIHAVAEAVPAPLFTALGTPIAWLIDHRIPPGDDEDWDAADYVDSDGDGALNWQEYVAGTRPDDEESVLKIVTIHALQGLPVYLEWIGGTIGPVSPYIVDSSPTLIDPDWQPIGTRARVEGLNDWMGGEPLDDHRFFRIRATRDE